MFPFCQLLKSQISECLLDLIVYKPAERGKYVYCVSSWNINKEKSNEWGFILLKVLRRFLFFENYSA